MTDHRIDRPAEPEELCTRGRPALVVINAGRAGLVGWCGQEVADREGPCRFCGGARHQGICPRYQLRPDAWAGGVEGRGATLPSLASQQLALALDDPDRTTALPSRPADRRSR